MGKMKGGTRTGRMLPKPFVFVLMPFAEEYNDVYKFGIKESAEKVGAYAERLDEQIFGEGMIDRIFNQINKADVIIADMTGRNPNVFYEVGYAHALGKIVILVAKDIDDIPFDLKHRQAIIYKGRIVDLQRQIMKRLVWAIKESKIVERNPRKISVHLGEVDISSTISNPKKFQYEFAKKNWPRSHFMKIKIQLRNDSDEMIARINRIYLFTYKESPLAPYEQISYLSDGSISLAYEIACLNADLIGYDNNFVCQYQLPLTYKNLPPTAAEEKIIYLVAKKEIDSTVPFMLRVHLDKTYHDFRFEIITKFEKYEESSY